MNISKHFIDLPSEEVDSGLNHALESIGEFVGVDRTYVFLFSDDMATMDNTHEWCSVGIGPQIDNLKAIDVKVFPWLMQRLKRFEMVHVPRVSDLAEEAGAEKEEFMREGIQSLIVAPLVDRGRVVGCLGFDSVRREKVWSEDNILLLKMVGEIFVNALQRKKSEEGLQSQLQRLGALRNIDMAISSSLDISDVLNILLEMASSTIEHIFEPFYTTKPFGKGTGLGLSVVYGIVKAHGGWIEVKSAPGAGSTFKVYVPVVDVRRERKHKGGGSVADIVDCGDGERVLVVDDEEVVRTTTRIVLEQNGYRVVEAPNAEGALDILKSDEGGFQLAIVDVVLPDRDGVELAAAMTGRNPALKVIMMSGYLDDKSQMQSIRKKGMRFMEKPYEVTEFLKAVKDTIGGASVR